eukprot:TRINITY_DN95958_c0_g1_i1.p1 TRINITY_DN95958_c0_g1~~TRINITY_DN95958_c0_g1_i1.p1  ORF type:complete len:314 (-),score=53.71 TRINITY_DN95958_c0_g1_i1:63-1004(-)
MELSTAFSLPSRCSGPSDALLKTCSRVLPVLSATRQWCNGAQSWSHAAGFAAFVSFLAARSVRQRRCATPRLRLTATGDWPTSFVIASSAGEALEKVKWPAEWPYTEEDFTRQDESEDSFFYSQPRLCTHVDDGFIATLTKHYAEVFSTYPNARILDICSSWISHYPAEKCWSHVSITGMNEYELQNNKQADDYTVRNLNVTPQLPYDDESFDIVTCTVSFDYLNKPLAVMNEVARVLKPGGTVILSTSNRCFPSKAVNIWLRTGDLEHVLIYGSYMHYTGAFDAPRALDLSSPLSRVGFADPVYVIQARKKT